MPRESEPRLPGAGRVGAGSGCGSDEGEELAPRGLQGRASSEARPAGRSGRRAARSALAVGVQDALGDQQQHGDHGQDREHRYDLERAADAVGEGGEHGVVDLLLNVRGQGLVDLPGLVRAGERVVDLLLLGGGQVRGVGVAVQLGELQAAVDAAHQGDAEGAADHAAHLEGARRRPRLCGRRQPHRGVAQRRGEQADTHALDEDRQGVPPVRRVDREEPGEERPDTHDQRAGGEREPRPAAQLQARADGDEHQHAHRGRQQVETGGEGVVAAHLLEVQGEHVHRAGERDVVDEVVDERAVERAAAEEREVEERLAHAALDEHEGGEQHDGEGEGGEDEGGGPAARRRLVERVQQRDEAGGHGAEAGVVEAVARALVARLGGRARDEHEGERAGRQVDPEDRRPAEELDEAAGDGRRGGLADRRGGHPGAERRHLVLPAELDGDDRQRGGEDGGRADAHQRAAGDQHARGRRESGQHGGRGEDDEADAEHAPPAEDVAEAAGGDDQRAADEREDGVDPLQCRDGAAEVVGDGGGGDGDVGGGEPDDGRREAQGDERPPALRAGDRCGGRGRLVGRRAGRSGGGGGGCCGRSRLVTRRLAPVAHFCSAIPAMNRASASVQRSSSPRSTLSLGAWILHIGSSAPQRIISAPGIAPRNAATSGIEPPSP